MTQHKQSIRFIHLDLCEYTYPRYTIAYIRTPELVYFAVSKLNDADTYSKKFGRELTTKRLTEFMTSGINPDNYCGVVTKKELFINSDLQNILSDQILTNVTIMDLKHRIIGNCILDKVFDLT